MALNSPLEVKPQSLCPFPRDCWRSRPVAMIMLLEFYRKASNMKTYGVNLDAPRLAHTREPEAQSLQANPRPGPLWACQLGHSGQRSLSLPTGKPKAKESELQGMGLTGSAQTQLQSSLS